MEVRSDRTYRFGVDPAEVWRALDRVDDYQRWWPWLAHMDGTGLVEGDRWDCIIRPPLPYRLRLSIHLHTVHEGERIEAVVSGDIDGDASVTIQPTAEGCHVRLTSVLHPQHGTLRAVARWAPAIAHFGHDWVLDTGCRQFRRRAL